MPLITTIEARFYGDIGGDTLYLQTNWNAPNERLLSLDLTHLDLTQATDAPVAPELLKELVPTSPTAVLEGFSLAGGQIILNYLQDVTSRVQIFDPAGSRFATLSCPRSVRRAACTGGGTARKPFTCLRRSRFPLWSPATI